MHDAYIFIGSNIERETNYLEAVKRLRALGNLVAISPVYDTPALGGDETTPRFYNGAARLDTELSPHALRNALREIESDMGRVRTTNKYAPRTIDLDLVLYSEITLADGELKIPDPDIFKRGFMARALAQVNPDYVIPPDGPTLAELACRVRAKPGEMTEVDSMSAQVQNLIEKPVKEQAIMSEQKGSNTRGYDDDEWGKPMPDFETPRHLPAMRVAIDTETAHAAIAEAVRTILLNVGEDPTREGLLKTPERVARAYDELLAGYNVDPVALINDAFFDTEYHDMVVVKDIEFFSMCVPSKQIVNAVEGAKRAASVQVGDKLWTLENGQVVETTVNAITSRKTHELVEIATTQGVIRVTPDHPFATPDGWVEAQDLEGKQVEWTAPKSLCRERYEPQMGYSLGYAIGTMFSDGTVGDRYISVIVNERDYAEKFAAAMSDAFNVTHELEAVERFSGFLQRPVAGWRVRIVSSYLADLFRAWAGGDANHLRQHFPRVVLNSRDCMQGFIEGYRDGDGFQNKNALGSTLVSSNIKFLYEMADIIDARFTPARQGSSQLYVSDRWDQPRWFGKHGFQQEDHRTSLVESTFVEVLSVKRITAGWRKPFTVYSFSCSPHPTFLIGGHLSHNCEHHMLPFFGKAHVAYIPERQVLGLSKIPRIVDMFARRLQLQEKMTHEIADFLQELLHPRGVAVIVTGQHLCSMMRGVNKPGAKMVTQVMYGAFQERDVRDQLNDRLQQDQ